MNASKPLRAIELYEKGVYTAQEMTNQMFENLTESNVADFLLNCPNSILEMLRMEASLRPANDDESGWNNCFTFIGGTEDRSISPEESAKTLENIARRFQSGIIVFRQAIEKAESSEKPN